MRRWYGKRADSHSVSLAAQQQIQVRMTHIRTLCASVSLFLAPSRFLREQFVAFGVPQEKILFHECGLQTEAIQPAPKPFAPQKNRGERSLVFGYIGVVDPVKGVHLLVEAFQALPQAGTAYLWRRGGLCALSGREALPLPVGQLGPYSVHGTLRTV